MVIYRQYEEATKTKIALRRTYNLDSQADDIIKFLKQVHTIYFRSNNGGLFFGLYKQVVSVKLLNNFSNNKLHCPHSFKEEIKIKLDVVKSVVEKFPNGTGAIMELLKAEPIPLT